MVCINLDVLSQYERVRNPSGGTCISEVLALNVSHRVVAMVPLTRSQTPPVSYSSPGSSHHSQQPDRQVTIPVMVAGASCASNTPEPRRNANAMLFAEPPSIVRAIVSGISRLYCAMNGSVKEKRTS